MKRILLAVAVVITAALSAPVTAHAQSACAWWDLTCNGMASRVSDYGWHIAGRDANGNVEYLRRRVDSNGNVLFDQSRRDDVGRYLVGNTHTIRKGTVYGSDGAVCKYNSNDTGYKEDCKYAKGSVLAGRRPTNTRSHSTAGDCKYKSNSKGYSEQCKYAKPNKAGKAGHYDKAPHAKDHKEKGPKH